jgi:CBS-domain-containing membrane protein
LPVDPGASGSGEWLTILPWVSPTESLNVVLESMEENNMRFLAVLDDKHRVMGITGQKTLMAFLGGLLSSGNSDTRIQPEYRSPVKLVLLRV